MLQLAFWTLPWSPVCNLRNRSRSSLSCREVVINLENLLLLFFFQFRKLLKFHLPTSGVPPVPLLFLLSGLLCPSACLPGPDPCLIQEAFLNSPPGAGPFCALPVDTFFCCTYHVASVCMSFSLQKSETTSLSGLFPQSWHAGM